MKLKVGSVDHRVSRPDSAWKPGRRPGFRWLMAVQKVGVFDNLGHPRLVIVKGMENPGGRGVRVWRVGLPWGFFFYSEFLFHVHTTKGIEAVMCAMYCA